MDFAQLRKFLPKTKSDAVSLIIFLFLGHCASYFEIFVILPFVYRDGWDYTYYIHLFFIGILYFNCMGNMYRLIMTETGSAGLMLPIVLKEGWKFCAVCECNAPPRAYHCSLCNKCILKRDHHCQFTGNCVGFANLRFYMHMLGYMWIAILYANIMNFDYAYITLDGFSAKSLILMILPLLAWLCNFSETYTITSAFMTSMCLVTFLLVSALLLYHMRNIIGGQTVNENTYNIKTFDLGWKKNIMIAFGRNWKYCWLCPFISSPLVGDGTQFSNKELFEASKDM